MRRAHARKSNIRRDVIGFDIIVKRTSVDQYETSSSMLGSEAPSREWQVEQRRRDSDMGFVGAAHRPEPKTVTLYGNADQCLFFIA